MRDSGSLHLRVWLDPKRAGVGLAATFLLRVRPEAIDGVVDALAALDTSGYLATLAGGHDIMVDVFCRDVSHLNEVLHRQVQTIDGVESVTTYLITDIKYESNLNISSLLNGSSDGADAGGADGSGSRRAR